MLAFAAPVFADSPGQLAGGSNVYAVKNVTKSGSYGASAAVSACGDVMQFSIYLHNTEFSQLDNIQVTATLGASSTVTATPSTGASTGTTGTVTVTGLPSNGSLSYVAGSTKLYDGNDALVRTLPDGITTSAGINAGSLMGSTTEFINFQAKVNCTTTPTTPPAKTLPNTGAGSVAALFAGVAAASAVAYNVVLRRQNAR